MRVGLVIYGSLDIVSGGYLYDRKLVEHLREQGDEITIISLERRNYLGSIAQNWSPGLYSRLNSSAVDILLQDELNHPSLFWQNRKLRGCPRVTIVHHLRSSENHPWWQRPLYHWVEARYLRSVDGFVYNSETTRREVERLTCGQRPSVVAYPAGDRFQAGVTPSQIEARAQAPGPLRILFVGNLIPRKGLHTLLSALALLPHEAWRLEIVGSLSVDQRYAASVRRQIARLGLTEGVSLKGVLEEKPLEQCFRKAHLLAVPSTYEGFGIVYLEGMAFGLPAIATLAGAAGEIIEDGKTGFLVPPGDARALAERLSRLIMNRETLSRMGLEGRKRFQRHPTWRDTASRIREFLCSMVR